jgi:hypothetical protein
MVFGEFKMPSETIKIILDVIYRYLYRLQMNCSRLDVIKQNHVNITGRVSLLSNTDMSAVHYNKQNVKEYNLHSSS